jgi:Ca2+-binding RTX toxin-like protein
VITGTDGQDSLKGTSGDDQITGGADDDLLQGDAGNDTIDGGNGNDLIAGFGGSDSILGGDGNDSINGGDGADKLYGGDGTDLLVGKAGNDDLRGGDYNPLLTAHGQVYRLYLAALDREPDEVGFANWVAALANGTTLAGITTGFVNSTEFQARYGVLNDTQFITLLYNNALDRAPDSGGLAHWVGALAGGATRESIVNGFSESQEMVGNTDLTLVGYMRSISPWRNTLDGGAGDDTLLGGRGVDTFVFDANEDGSDTVYGLDDWDMLRFENFGFNRSSDVFNFFSETNGEAVFSYEGVSITFDNTPLAGIDIGMVLI